MLQSCHNVLISWTFLRKFKVDWIATLSGIIKSIIEWSQFEQDCNNNSRKSFVNISMIVVRNILMKDLYTRVLMNTAHVNEGATTNKDWCVLAMEINDKYRGKLFRVIIGDDTWIYSATTKEHRYGNTQYLLLLRMFIS